MKCVFHKFKVVKYNGLTQYLKCEKCNLKRVKYPSGKAFEEQPTDEEWS